MRFARRFAIFCVSAIFIGLLLALPALVSLNRTIGDANTIKLWLRGSKFYDRAADGLVEQGSQALKAQGNPTGPEVKAAARQAFGPQFLQSSTENVIDGVFGWLKGVSTKPEFQINIVAAKHKFANAINQSAKQRYASLPPCSRRQPPPTEFDPFIINCRIPGYNANATIDKLTADLANNKDFLGNKPITADDIKLAGGSSQQPLYRRWHVLPTLYRLSRLGMVVLPFLALVFAAGLIFLYPQKGQGIRRVGVKLLVTGCVIILGAIGLGLASGVINRMLVPGGTNTTPALQQSGLYIAGQAEQRIRAINLAFGITYGVLGAGSLVALRFVFKPKAAENAEKTA